MLKVEIQRYESLSPAEREEWGDEWANYLRVTHGGNNVALHSDSMEPEDARFTRDLRWVRGVIQQSYELGVADGNHPLVQKIMARLTDLLDADQFNNIEAMVVAAGVPYPPPSTGDANG